MLQLLYSVISILECVRAAIEYTRTTIECYIALQSMLECVRAAIEYYIVL